MCSKCNNIFIIHDCKELIRYLKVYNYREDVLELWFKRGYFTNLIYLEYLEQQVDKNQKLNKV